jgi:hypothetical protein
MRGLPAPQLAIPAYFRPGPFWQQMQHATTTVGIAVVNPASGPGAMPDPDYATTIAAAHKAGIRVCGYVDTDRTARDIGAVQADIDHYFAWYPIGGIFLDQADTTATALPYYAALYRFIRARGADARIILNPGAATDERYMAVADVVVTFEDTWRSYVANYLPASWERRYAPTRFWHLVHSTQTKRQLRRAVSLSRKRGAGYLYVTSGTLPNPWDHLPDSSYWSAEQDALTN